MAFGIGVNAQGTNAGSLPGKQMDIACECWFTSRGSTRPLMIKFEDEEGMIQTIRDIRIHYAEDKNYGGIPSREYACTVVYQGREIPVRLLYFKEECRWAMRL